MCTLIEQSLFDIHQIIEIRTQNEKRRPMEKAAFLEQAEGSGGFA